MVSLIGVWRSLSGAANLHRGFLPATQGVGFAAISTSALASAGHSHWANIKHKKASSDARKASTFNKICKAILAEAKMNADPNSNLRLASLISRARNNNVPKDKIEATLQRATSDDTSNSEHITYEGMGPGGVAVLISTLTDNRNRTHAQLRSIFNRAGGNLGSNGSVMWMFDRLGVLQFDGKYGEEKITDIAIEAGATNVINQTEDHGGKILVYCQPGSFFAVKTSFESADIHPSSAEVTFVPNTTHQLDDEESTMGFSQLVDNLEDHDDVDQVYHNLQ